MILVLNDLPVNRVVFDERCTGLSKSPAWTSFTIRILLHFRRPKKDISRNIVIGKCFQNQNAGIIFLKKSYFFISILVTQNTPHNQNLMDLMKIEFDNLYKRENFAQEFEHLFKELPGQL